MQFHAQLVQLLRVEAGIRGKVLIDLLEQKFDRLLLRWRKLAAASEDRVHGTRYFSVVSRLQAGGGSRDGLFHLRFRCLK